MKLEECKVGTKVICRYNDANLGRIGTISEVRADHLTRYPIRYEVVDERGFRIGGSWSQLSSWDLCEENKEPIGSEHAKQESQRNISDWRAWAHNRPGECACGIPREICTYHKN